MVLVLLGSYGDGVRGRTLLQKISYFAAVMAGLDLGFRAHFYGPYSPIVEQAVGELKGLGFVSEQAIGFGVVQNPHFGEMTRFDYLLTPDGKAVLEDLRKRIPEECESLAEVVRRIKDAGNPDYRELSLAAKTFFILRRQGKPTTFGELENEAKSFSWQLPQNSVKTAVEFLVKLGLVQ
jgi:uncharacterized protein YwgA